MSPCMELVGESKSNWKEGLQQASFLVPLSGCSHLITLRLRLLILSPLVCSSLGFCFLFYFSCFPDFFLVLQLQEINLQLSSTYYPSVSMTKRNGSRHHKSSWMIRVRQIRGLRDISYPRYMKRVQEHKVLGMNKKTANIALLALCLRW
jgi:hypothetical protein